MHWLKITSLSIVSFGFCILLILGLLIFTGKNTQPTDKPDAILRTRTAQPCFASSVRCGYPLY